MKLAFNSLISSTGTFASRLKDTFFVDNLLVNRAKDLPVIREETVDLAFNVRCLSEDRSTVSMPLKDRHWSGLNYWQIYAKHASLVDFCTFYGCLQVCPGFLNILSGTLLQ